MKIKVDDLSEKSLNYLHELLDMDLDEMFGLWVCMAEAMAEKWTAKFCTKLVYWAYQSIDEEEENRWDLVRQCVVAAITTTPLEMKRAFLEVKSPFRA